MELDAALRTLKQSQISLNEQQTLLREARASFNKAIGLEKDEERLVIAYIGLSLCHYQLGDIANAKNTLVEFSDIEFNMTPQEIASAMARDGLFIDDINPFYYLLGISTSGIALKALLSAIQLVRYLISTITAFSKPVLKRICSHQHQSKFN